jgi:tetratricopeptide (TPR) repeat protein
VLKTKIAEEERERARRLVPLLKEQATIERLSFDHEAAKASLHEVVRLDPDDVRSWIDLGDIWRMTGSLVEASKAYRGAEAAARRTKSDRDLSVSCDRVGDVLVSQGNLAEALKSYRAGLEISERLAASDAANTDWQRDLSVSYNKVGDVLVSQGNLAEALKSYRADLEISERLAASDAANSEWQRDLIVSYKKIADCAPPKEKRANLSRALKIARAKVERRRAHRRMDAGGSREAHRRGAGRVTTAPFSFSAGEGVAAQP